MNEIFYVHNRDNQCEKKQKERVNVDAIAAMEFGEPKSWGIWLHNSFGIGVLNAKVW